MPFNVSRWFIGGSIQWKIIDKVSTPKPCCITLSHYFAVQNRPTSAVFSYSRTQALDSVSSRGNVGGCLLVPVNSRPGFSCLWHTPPVVAAVDVHTKTMDLALGAQIYAILDTL